MTRAVPVADDFDPIPSLQRVPAISIEIGTDVDSGDLDVRVVVLHEGTETPDVPDTSALAASGFTAARGTVHLVAGLPPLAIVGAGGGPLDPSAARDLGSAVVGAVPTAATVGVDLRHVALDAGSVAAFVEGAILSRYAWDELRSSPSVTSLAALRLAVADRDTADATLAGVERGRTMALATSVARDLANCPPAHLTAVRWATIAQRVAAGRGLGVEVRDRDWLLAERCGGIIAVNGGSDEEPRLITLTYEPHPDVANGSHVALVGKGLTYDSGGIAIKPGDAVHAMMKNDMSGGGAVFAAMLVLADLRVPTKVTAHVMCTDNMPSGTALNMGDVITHRDGTTVEILNTDAEGRLVMADALVMAGELAPDAVIDVATLTGAAMRALGTEIAAVLGTDQTLVDLIISAGADTSEPVWQLPMGDHFRAELDSDVADMTNLGRANAGASSAAEFLAHFTHGLPWAHIDMAGVAAVAKPGGWKTRGMSGFGARLLVEVLERFDRKG